mmetsp:Transcript_43731/g.126313  ORF Transcript_43731/g.126313 Transcript_43731/m.126313 type:complete len:440 (-) Transcript_43731:47-1366(-)
MRPPTWRLPPARLLLPAGQGRRWPTCWLRGVPAAWLLVGLTAAEGTAVRSTLAASSAAAAPDFEDGCPGRGACCGAAHVSAEAPEEALPVQLLQQSLALERQAADDAGAGERLLSRRRVEQAPPGNDHMHDAFIAMEVRLREASHAEPFAVMLIAGCAVFICLFAVTMILLQGVHEASSKRVCGAAAPSEQFVRSSSRAEADKDLPRQSLPLPASQPVQPQVQRLGVPLSSGRLPSAPAVPAQFTGPTLPARQLPPTATSTGVGQQAFVTVPTSVLSPAQTAQQAYTVFMAPPTPSPRRPSSSIAVPVASTSFHWSSSQLAQVDVPPHLAGFGAQLGIDLSEDDLTVVGFASEQAMSLGLDMGDRIVQVNGQPVSSQADFLRELSAARGRRGSLNFGVVRAAALGYRSGAASTMPAEALRMSLASSVGERQMLAGSGRL